MRVLSVLVTGLLFSGSVFGGSIAKAEYRAYRLNIRNTETGSTREVLSTLDHIQYPGYYHVAKNEVIEIASTWRCWDRSDDFTPICPDPSAQANANAGLPSNSASGTRAPASQ